ncbi:MAG TPA: hypothetical protein VJ866_13450 [Pyrinomonadaceae bacterium]|nr:hypothetical protein [Pyrinomonadaceae bacterium]
MEHYLNAEHCLTIAAAFIAIVGACASLISLANGKSDSIATRYRELTREYRDVAAKEGRTKYEDYRLDQLKRQLKLYKKRVKKVVEAQGILFSTICIFVGSLAIFIVLALLIVILNWSDAEVYRYAKIPLGLIGICVLFGAFYMYRAVGRLYAEIKEAKATFDIETEDCLPQKAGSLQAELQVA